MRRFAWTISSQQLSLAAMTGAAPGMSSNSHVAAGLIDLSCLFGDLPMNRRTFAKSLASAALRSSSNRQGRKAQ